MDGRGRAALAVLGVIAVLVAGILAFVGNREWREIHEPFKGYQGAEQFVDSPSGSSTGEIRRRLIESGVVSNEFALRAALWWSGRSRSLKAGEYRFDRAMTAVEVVDKLTQGDVYTRRMEGVSIWVVPSSLIVASAPDDKAEFFEPAGDKIYRHPTFYDIPDEVGHM